MQLRQLDRQLLLAALLSLAIVLPRSLLINHAHSPCVDDDHHLDQGLMYLRGDSHPLTYYDPPLGKMILALPLYVIGADARVTWYAEAGGQPKPRRTVLYNQPFSLETIRLIQAAWKSLLFVPCVLVAFAWSRRLWGPRAAWLAAALLWVDPTLAGHIPVAALDVLAMEGVIIASYCAWRYIEHPNVPRLIVASIAAAVALLVKHTAFALPLAFVVLALLHWLVRPMWQGTSKAELRRAIRPRLNALAAAIFLVCASIWALTLFDFSPPSKQRTLSGISYQSAASVARFLEPAMELRWPAGVYIGSFISAVEHSDEGQSAYLFGEIRDEGWWFYFPAVAMLKVPLGIWLILALALLSAFVVKPRWEELSIVVPLVACGALIMNSGINVGFRHALPTYGLLLILASRCAAGPGKVWPSVAWLGVIGTALHSLTFHPDYITYANGLWRRPELAITDSNLDWGQSMKQVREWYDAHPQLVAGRDVAIDPFNEVGDPAMEYYFGGRIRRLYSVDPVPSDGILILSPARLVGVYNFGDKYAHLRDAKSIDVIGHCLLVYDLDALRQQ